MINYKNIIKELIKNDPSITIEEFIYNRDNIRYRLYQGIEKALKEIADEIEQDN